MDTGHYNCRDYHVSPHLATESNVTGSRPTLYRDESYEELIERSRSPASMQPKFPLLRLPLELRQQVLSYVLPRTTKLATSIHARARALDSDPEDPIREEARMQHDRDTNQRSSILGPSIGNVVWLRGHTSVLAVCSQLHREAAELIYSMNTFLLFLSYNGINFRFRWLVPQGVAPSTNYPFLDMMPRRYLNLIRRITVHIDHVDSYTGIIKFNVGGRGLIHGLRKQVVRLVYALQPLDVNGDDAEPRPRLNKVTICVSTANAVIDSLNARNTRNDSRTAELSEREQMQKKLQQADVQSVLEPFGDLMGVRDACIFGAVSHDFASALEARMHSTEPHTMHACCDELDKYEKDIPQLCVYGHDI